MGETNTIILNNFIDLTASVYDTKITKLVKQQHR